MSTAALVLLAAYALWSMRAAWRHPGPRGNRFDPWAFALQAPLFALCCVLAFRAGVFSRSLLSPAAVVLGLAGGHLVFGLSLLITHRVWRDIREHVLDVRGFAAFLADNPMIDVRFFGVALTEEIIYRAAGQELLLLPLTGSPWAAVIITAVLFSVVHDHFFRNSPAGSLEFLGFALLLGVLYHVTASLTLVVLIHVIRNLESVYLEYLALAEEKGGTEARETLDKMYARRSGETL